MPQFKIGLILFSKSHAVKLYAGLLVTVYQLSNWENHWMYVGVSKECRLCSRLE